MSAPKASAASFPILIAFWLLLCGAAAPPQQAEECAGTSEKRQGYEGSSLLTVENAALLKANGWKRAFWVAFDERKSGNPLGLLYQKADGTCGLKDVPLSGSANPIKIDDSEALARKDGFIYLVGSHFGKKKGNLEAVRQFVGRFQESKATGTSPVVDLQIVRDDFRLHRLINDALAQQGVDLIARGNAEQTGYIEKTRTGGEPGKENVREGDRAINIEGATFLPSGQLALGLRYPVSKQGEPLVVVLNNVEALFSNGGLPAVAAIWTLHGAGAPAQPLGIRALESAGNEIQAIVGSIERTAEELPVILQDHPGADQILSKHLAFTTPMAPATTAKVRIVRDLAPAGNVEGVVVDPDGSAWYLFDEKTEVHAVHEKKP